MDLGAWRAWAGRGWAGVCVVDIGVEALGCSSLAGPMLHLIVGKSRCRRL